MRRFRPLFSLSLLAVIAVSILYFARRAVLPDDTVVVQGITLVSIPGGTFQMGSTAGDDDERPVHSVTLSAFEMSRYEVTNSQYAEYLNTALSAGEITATSSSVTGTSGDYSGQEYINLSGSYDSNNECWISYGNNTFTVASGKENRPVVYVSWYGAKAFALKNGMDLPTEAQCGDTPPVAASSMNMVLTTGP